MPQRRCTARHISPTSEMLNSTCSASPPNSQAQGVTVSQHVHEVPVGNVPRNIAAHAAQDGAELILLSTHEVTDPRSWLMGAVAQDVIRYAAPPVLLLRNGRNAPATFAPGEVVVALDNEGHGEITIPGALRMAHALGVPLRLLSVVPTAETMPGDRAAATRLLPSGANAALDLEAQSVASDLAVLAGRLRSENPGVNVVGDRHARRSRSGDHERRPRQERDHRARHPRPHWPGRTLVCQRWLSRHCPRPGSIPAGRPGLGVGMLWLVGSYPMPETRTGRITTTTYSSSGLPSV